MSRFYDGAADSMEAPFEPKTPCRNMETRPCVILTHDNRQRFPVNQCLPHCCVRHRDKYEEGQIPHEWVLDQDSARTSVEAVPAYFELGDYHGGPKCVRCEMIFCQHCTPRIFTELCTEQDQTLF